MSPCARRSISKGGHDDEDLCDVSRVAGPGRDPAGPDGHDRRPCLRFCDRQGAAGRDGCDLDDDRAALRDERERGGGGDSIELITSQALPNVPGKRITVVRVSYAPGGFSRPHRHAGSVTAYITNGQIRSQLGGGPVETFQVGQSFFEPPGSTHMVSANASATEPAELIAVFVADEGAELTTYLD